VKQHQIVIIIVLLIFSFECRSQDSQYWTQTYGTTSTLLGGVVVGSVSDLGATYYNPGNLSLADDPNFLFTARVFEFSSLQLDPENSKINDFGTTSFKPSPSFVVANITADWLGKNRVAFSILTRQTMDLRLKTRFDGTDDNKFLSNEFTVDEQLNDFWVGITWSYPFEKKLGIGITQYVGTRYYTSRNEVNLKTSDSLDRVSSVSGITDYEYLDFRILWKAGIGFTLEKIKFGLTITSPSVSLFGSGSTDINLSASGLEYNNGADRDDFLISNYQEDLPSTYNSPLSFGLGAAYKFGQFKLHIATEYYSTVLKYNILSPEPFNSQTGDLTITNNLSAAADDVLNYGMGFEMYINPKFTLYGAFSTDFSAYAKGEDTNSSVSRWDFYHVTAGAAFTWEKLEITSGVATSFANDDIVFPNIIPETDEEGGINSPKQSAGISSFRIKLILGITF
jgi:hypothetical protein